jgi:hypothetical protein
MNAFDGGNTHLKVDVRNIFIAQWHKSIGFTSTTRVVAIALACTMATEAGI